MYSPCQIINRNTRPINDFRYVGLQTQDSKRESDYKVKNYRTTEYTRNPQYHFPIQHTMYDLQNIDEGKGPGMNPNLDSALQRAHFQDKPADRLQEAVSYIRYIDFLPCETLPIDHNKFLVATSLSTDPQHSFNPEFYRPGVCARNYGRFSDEYFRKYANKSNKYRLPSKIVRCTYINKE